MKLSEQDITRFWMALHLELQRLEIPMKRISERAVDVGWGRGCRICITDIDQITCPDTGYCEFLNRIEPAAFAQRIQKAMRLTRTEREALELVRSGWHTRCHTAKKMVTFFNQANCRWFRRSTLERLSFLGLVDEQLTNDAGTDIGYVAVQPRSVA